MSTQFVSTSYDFKAAQGFSGSSRSDSQSWLLNITAEPYVSAIDVLSVLPRDWRCYASEREVILAPGTRYELLSSKMGNDGTRRLWVVAR